MQSNLDVLFGRFFNGLSWLLMFAAVVLIALMAVHVVADIGSRLLFRTSLEAVTEIVSYYYMVGVIFLPLLYARRTDALMKAEILSGFMSPRLIRFLDAFFDVVLGLWFFLFAYVTWDLALDKTNVSEFVETTSGILTVWPSRWLLPLSTAAAGMYCLLRGGRDLFTKSGPTESADVLT